MPVRHIRLLHSIISRPSVARIHRPPVHRHYSVRYTHTSRMSHTNLSPRDVDLVGMRMAYRSEEDPFLETDLVSKDPIQQFSEWMRVAASTDGIGEANSMMLATSTKDGFPSARMVLLKGFDESGFKFYTNYESRKGKELLENPRACLVFYWEILSRSVRIHGTVEELTVEDSTEYFHSRPRGSQIGASISQQSTPIESRQVLIDRETLLKEKYGNPESVIPKPDYWGGYRVIPESIEFWQGQSTRIHDRINFRRPRNGERVDGRLLHQGEGDWVYERLSP